MKPALLSIAFCLGLYGATAQSSLPNQVRKVNPPAVALQPLHFLAADELMGRSTTRPEIHVAARYISEQFRSFGLKPAPGAADYFQTFDLKMSKPAHSGGFTVGGTTYAFGEQLLPTGVEDVSLQAPVVYAGWGSKEDFEKLDVKGAIVVTNMGRHDSSTFMEGYRATAAKRKLAADKGAVALVERFREAGTSWTDVQHYLLGERVASSAPSGGLPVLMLNDKDTPVVPLLKGSITATLSIGGNRVDAMPARNVIGMVEGTDPKLKGQYIVLSAHYDHVGVAAQPRVVDGKPDSIYNGARDNAVGVAAVINAARYFARHPAKRSILFVAYTGEEMGMVGSQHFVANPPVPLERMVYNLNIDNAGYNDTTIVTVIGLGRTSADADIKRGAAAFGLTAIADPAPEQGLFDRSDNAALAFKGIPAPTYSLGFRQFDRAITNHYHQVSDEVGSFNLSYALKYMNSFILAAKYIADNPAQPVWQKGDKYEAAWKELYKKPL
ncbi:MAG TPA: M28 family peptidase [Chitinophagaceae bacterium]